MEGRGGAQGRDLRTMKVVLVLLTFVLLYGVYEAIRVYSLATKSQTLIAGATAFSREGGAMDMLVLGDSTAVGVGATPETSVPGRVSDFLNASVENYAVSGARVVGLFAQIEKAQKESYDFVLIQVGANDITHGTPPQEVRADLDKILSKASSLSERVVVLTAGKVGDAPLIPWFARSLLNSRTAKVRDVFMETTGKHGAVYVDIYSRELNFSDDVPRFYAPDQFHLSGDGYGEWFSIVREYVEKKWPELERNK